MDLTAFLTGAFLLLSALGLDTVMHPRDIVLEAHKAPQLGQVQLTDSMLSAIMKAQVEEIFLTKSVVTKPTIRLSKQKGIGVTITDSIGLSAVASALQEQMGYRPDRIELHVFKENETTKVLVSGYHSRQDGMFEQEVVPVKNERIVSLVQRATVVAMATIDPYVTALSLMRRHIKDRDFSQSEDVIAFAKSRLRSTPVNAERSMLENLEGMIALFRQDSARARDRFKAAVASDPGNHVAALNLALVLLEDDRDARVAAMMADILRENPPLDPALLATVHMTQAAAFLGLRQPAPADAAMAKAAALNPTSPTILNAWAEVKTQMGDKAAAAELDQLARSAPNTFEDFAEVAALSFTLAWQKGEPVLRSPFENIGTAADTADTTAPTAPETATKTAPAKEPAVETPPTR
jgi:hypothetical protein